MIREFLQESPCLKNCALPCDICVNFAIPKIVERELGEERKCLDDECEQKNEGCLGECDAYKRFELREKLQSERRQILGIKDDVNEDLPF